MQRYHSPLGVVTAFSPSEPVTCIRPHAAHRAARTFVEGFAGRSLYAVKANPSPDLLTTLWDAGITHYDVASLAEVRLVRAALPEATLCFMHPVKPVEAIRSAYFDHGVRVFSLDSQAELDKILLATGHAADLTLCVRLRVSSQHSKVSLAAKFGISVEDAPALLMAARQASDVLGVCFHVGSQAMTPQAYADAMQLARAAIVKAGVTVDVVDVGGGFPSVYPGMNPPPLAHYFQLIAAQFEDMPISYSAELWCEPGRALCAEYASVIVRVEQRRGNELYINDGAYGSLFDAAHIGWRFPVKALGARHGSETAEFSFYGPTCDDMDHMRGPFALPEDIAVGDYVEIGMLGAYGACMRTSFNGFGTGETVLVDDAPMLSAYGPANSDHATGRVSQMPLALPRSGEAL